VAPSRTFLISGGGGHGKVVADLIRALGHRVAGYSDADPQKLGAMVEPGGATVVLGERELLDHLVAYAAYPVEIDALAIAIGDNALRERFLRRLGKLPVPFLVHPSAIVSPSARLGRGTVALAGVVVNADARVGDAVILNSGCIVEHDCVVESGAHVSPGAVLAGGVRVGERAWIGASAVVIPGVGIGADAVVGAGAVVVRDVPPRATVVGNPARILKRNPDE